MNTLRTLLLSALATLTALSAAGPAAAETRDQVPPVPRFDTSNRAGYGLQLARYMERFDSGWIDQYMKANMTLFDARGDSVRRKITQEVLEGASGDKSVIRFLRPAEIRGVAALVHEHPRSTDDSWLYLPSSRRVRRISGANRTASFQGTEFTYEDLSGLVVAKYRWSFVGNDALTVDGAKQKVHVIEAVPTFPDSGYSRLRVHLNRRYWRVERIDYFDKAGRKLKTLRYSKWQHLHKRFWRARRLEMANHQTRKRTVIDLQALFVDLARYPKKNGAKRANLAASRFTRHSLGH